MSRNKDTRKKKDDGPPQSTWGAHHVDIACWAIGASDTGPSKVAPVEYKLPVEYKDGYPVIDDQ